MSKLLTFEVISEGEIKVKIGNILLGYIFRSINKTTNRYFKFIANMQSLEYEELCEIVEKMNDIEREQNQEEETDFEREMCKKYPVNEE